jgi:hypothetical protein
MKDLLRSSRLALTCADAALYRKHPQVERGQPMRRRPRAIAPGVAETPGRHLPGPAATPAAGSGSHVNPCPAEREDLLVGLAGLEPAASCTQSTRASQAALQPVRTARAVHPRSVAGPGSLTLPGSAPERSRAPHRPHAPSLAPGDFAVRRRPVASSRGDQRVNFAQRVDSACVAHA